MTVASTIAADDRPARIDFQQLKSATQTNVPRYTSYPTAPHFNDSVGPDTIAAWRAALSPADPVSVYIHVPFCRTICTYCGCNTKASLRDEPIETYARWLVEEIEGFGVATTAGIAHLAWGGGTPSILSERAFLRVLEALSKVFGLRDNAEHSIELDPRWVTPELVGRLARAGVSRASLGVQDLDISVQEKIGRIQPFTKVRTSVELLRAAGIDSINLDLMFGLPGQTRDSILRTIDLALQLAPDRLALFGYAHVPWMKPHQRLIDEKELPTGDDRLNLEAAARAHLRDAGYVPVGIDHFARPDDAIAKAYEQGELRRNFQGYTTDQAETLIGFGASAISAYPQGYAQNAPDTAGYQRRIEAGEIPVVRGRALTADDRARRAIIESLMTRRRVDVGEIAARYRLPICEFKPAFGQLLPLVQAGAVRVNGMTVEIEPEAIALSRLAASCFDAYLASGKARHSVAV